MIKAKLMCGKNSRFKGKLIEMVIDSNGNFNDYSISPKIKQILLHWDDELTKKDFFLMYKNELLSIQLIINFTEGKEKLLLSII